MPAVAAPLGLPDNISRTLVTGEKGWAHVMDYVTAYFDDTVNDP